MHKEKKTKASAYTASSGVDAGGSDGLNLTSPQIKNILYLQEHQCLQFRNALKLIL